VQKVLVDCSQLVFELRVKQIDYALIAFHVTPLLWCIPER
jgi:hypothetical protein